jgi:hypothetical protein
VRRDKPAHRQLGRTAPAVGAEETPGGFMASMAGAGCMTCPAGRPPFGRRRRYSKPRCPEARNRASAAADLKRADPAIASANPTSAAHELLLILGDDASLPADTRPATGRKVFQANHPRSAEDHSEKSTASLMQGRSETNQPLRQGSDAPRRLGGSLYGSSQLVSLRQRSIRTIEGQGERNLRPGDHVLIAAQRADWVTWTANDEPTIWLAIHLR